MGVGDVGEADPDGFGDAVEGDVADPGECFGDVVAAGAAFAGTITEDHVDLLGFGHAQGDAGGEQVPGRQHVFAWVLQCGDDEHAHSAAL